MAASLSESGHRTPRVLLAALLGGFLGAVTCALLVIGFTVVFFWISPPPESVRALDNGQLTFTRATILEMVRQMPQNASWTTWGSIGLFSVFCTLTGGQIGMARARRKASPLPPS